MADQMLWEILKHLKGCHICYFLSLLIFLLSNLQQNLETMKVLWDLLLILVWKEIIYGMRFHKIDDNSIKELAKTQVQKL